MKSMRVTIDGELGLGVTAKDVILYVIAKMTTAGGAGYAVEFAGSAIRSLSMEGRMTVCNMAIEMGARVGMIAPDETTFEWLKGRPQMLKGEAFEKAVEEWKKLPTDEGATFDKEVFFDASDIKPRVTWGTNPAQSVEITDVVPSPDDFDNVEERKMAKAALEYMNLKAGTPIKDVKLDWVFIGSCTNGRMEDFRAAAKVLKGYKIAEGVQAIAVPGSGVVKKQAEIEGLDKIFISAGFEWREPGCSMCLAMNPDRLKPGERCAGTSNRNFEGRMGKGGRTHLVSPAMAAAAAVAGHFVDIREW